ncbi:MAG: type II toxin-antitoxin system ParD family antitoxin [Microthrixaceae bacterium]
MNSLNVPLSHDLKEFVDTQVQRGGYESTGEYVRELIRRDRDRRQLRTALLDGAQSPVIATADAAYFALLRQGVEARA